MFSSSERLGMFFPVLGGCLSAIATSLVLLLAALRWLRRTVSGRRSGPDATDNAIFLNLMLSDLIQALGVIFIIWWMVEGVVTEGRFCMAQALIKQVGNNGVAFSSMAIAVHTFCVLVLRWNPPKYISKLVVLMIWVTIALIIVIPSVIYRKHGYYGDVHYWCWITGKFKTEQLVTEYIWRSGSLLVMGIFYAILFAVMRGWFIVENGHWHWYKNYMPRYGGADEPVEQTQDEKDSKAIANLFLLYPAIYLVCTLLNFVAQVRDYEGHETSYQFTFIAATLFSLSGTFNALLFFFTRPGLVNDTAYSALPTVTVDIPLQPFRDRESANYGSSTFGCLPSRSLPSRSPSPQGYVLPDIERDHNLQLHSYNSNLLTEVTHGT